MENLDRDKLAQWNHPWPEYQNDLKELQYFPIKINCVFKHNMSLNAFYKSSTHIQLSNLQMEWMVLKG